MDSNIIVLAAGAASRMKNASAEAKAMIRVGEGGRPFLDYLLFNIEKAGYRNALIVVGEKDHSIVDYYEKKARAHQFSELSISYVVQKIPPGREKPLGTADALLQALSARPSWKGQRLTVCNSDNLYSSTVLRLLLEDEHENSMIEYDRSALQFPEERVTQFAVIVKNDEGFLRDIIEKPSIQEVERARDAYGRIGVSMNLWRFTYNHIFPYLERTPLHPVRQEKELPVAVKMMVAQNPHSVFTIPFSEHVIDLTSQADIAIAKAYLRSNYSYVETEARREKDN